MFPFSWGVHGVARIDRLMESGGLVLYNESLVKQMDPKPTDRLTNVPTNQPSNKLINLFPSSWGVHGVTRIDRLLVSGGLVPYDESLINKWTLNRPTDRPTDHQPTNQPTIHPTNQPTNQLICSLPVGVFMV